MKYRKTYIPIWGFLIIILGLSLAAFGMSCYLKIAYPEAYENTNPDGTDGPPGFGKLTESKDKQYYYRLRVKDQAVMLINYCGTKKKVTIPEKVEGYVVKIIEGGTYSYKERLETLTINYDLEYIDLAAFSDDPKLKKVIFLGNVKDMDENMFYGTQCTVIAREGSNVYALAQKNNIKLEKLKSYKEE